MPFLNHTLLAQDHTGVFIGETEFVNTESKTKDEVKIYIYLASPKFNDAKLSEDFGKFSENGLNFVKEIKNYVNVFDRHTLRKMVESNSGELPLKLNSKSISLKHREHFFFDARDQRTV